MPTSALPEEQITQKVGFKRILMATDFSAASRRALDYALAIARRYGAEVTLMHAVAPEPRRPVPLDPLPGEMNREQLEAEEEMDRLAQAAGFGQIPVKIEVTLGDAPDVIASVVKRDRPDLLVLGTHGRGVFKQLVLGSVAEEVLREVSCPVLTVGSNAVSARSNVADFQSILFATDFGPACKSALAYAMSLAADCHAKLTLLHMLPPIATTEMGYAYSAGAVDEMVACDKRMQAESLKKLKALVPANEQLATPPEFVVDSSFLPEGIFGTANLCNADLIVMGANRTRNPRLAAHLPWNVVHEVLCDAKCPVLTVNS